MCGRLKWRTNAWRFSAARSSGIPRSSHMHVPKRLDRFTGHWGRGGGMGGPGYSPEGRRHHLTYFLNFSISYHTLLLDLNYPNALKFWKLSGEVTYATCSQLASGKGDKFNA